MNPKVERDRYLRLVAERWGEGAAVDAGWFDDGDPDDAPLDDVGWLCTPIAAVQRGRGGLTGSPVVLLSTGGFHPVHGGHLAMMEAARRAIDGAEDGRRRVIGGYLSPAHDDYIRLKCGAVDVAVSERLARADAVVAPTGWLSVDPWEALGRRVAVNYTDVTARLEAYLRHHVDPDIDIVYVCGADNARFSLAFTERGGCVVVGRPGCEATVARWRADPRVAGNPRIQWVDGDDASSSTALRAMVHDRRDGPVAPLHVVERPFVDSAVGDVGRGLDGEHGAAVPEPSPERVSARVAVAPAGVAARVAVEHAGVAASVAVASAGVTAGVAVAPAGALGGDGRVRLTLRLEDERAVATLGLPPLGWRRFQDGLVAELDRRVALRTVRIEDQDRQAKVAGTVSLDPMLPAEIDLGISRLFDLGGHRPLGHTARPGSMPLEDQLDSIPAGTWTLRDDDRATGATIAYVTAHLPDGVTLRATTFVLDPNHGHGEAGSDSGGGDDDSGGEIADSRDFLLGTDDGGLVVALPGRTTAAGDGTGRAPYLLPYVDPSVRSGLPGADAVAFSLAVWELNAAIFAATDLTVADLPPAAARTMLVAGFAPHTPLVDVARHHATILRTLHPLPA